MKTVTDRKLRIALFGGSFDPVHIGHLFVADEVRLCFGYDRVVFVPASQSPHKSERPGASAEDRLAMLERAIDQEAFVVDRSEIERGGLSYTVDTVRSLIEAGETDGKPGLIIGDDLVATFDRWREADELLRLTDLIVVRRDGLDLPDYLRSARTIDTSPLPVSSSMVRQRIRDGYAFRYLVSEGVFAYIEQNRLYRVDDNP